MGVVLPVLAGRLGVLIGMVGVGGVLLPAGLVALGDLTAAGLFLVVRAVV